jgi:hypothetical protein
MHHKKLFRSGGFISFAGMKLPDSILIVEQSTLARLAAAWMHSPKVAMVWGNRILLWGCSQEEFQMNIPWVRHELKHVEQYQRFGMVGFLARYLAYSIRFGYANNPLEVEARQAENNPHPDFG